MSLESLIEDSGQLATITAESDPGVPPAQTTMGGTDRSPAKWLAVVSGVPCLVSTKGSTLNYARNDERANVQLPRIYFECDPVPSGLTTKHRIVVQGGKDKTLQGTYAVQGVIDPNSMGRLFEVDCERIRTAN